MNPEKRDSDALNPDRYMERDVTDLRVEVGRFSERFRNIETNMVTKEQFAKRQVQALQLALQLIVPVLAATLGALAILFTGTRG